MISYQAAQAWVQAESIQSREKYRAFTKNAFTKKLLPTAPDTHYKEWRNWRHFLAKEEFDEKAYREQLEKNIQALTPSFFVKKRSGKPFEI